jgi:hypothetical protein
MRSRGEILALLAAACHGPGADNGWRPLFDGRTLDGWHPVAFGGEGTVRVRGGRIELDAGSPLTGVALDAGRPLPQPPYELAVRAARLRGSDFFLGLTFPVGGSHLTLVLGGWGGSLVGLSSLDGDDAAHNETRRFVSFDDGRTYAVRLRVDEGRVRAWIDGELTVDAATAGRALSLRPEVELTRPLGICCYNTAAAVSELAVREVR